MAELSVESLQFSYGQRPIIRDISFTARPGDFIAVLGPNGVGKSTMFKCILRFLKGYNGRVLIDGESTGTMTRKQIAQKVAYIPQSSSQVFDFSVLELVMLGYATKLPLFKTPDEEGEEQALQVLDSLGIAHLAHQGCGEISGGEYQLVLLARTLVQDARILIMDEPTANLDYGNQYRVMDRIAGLSRDDFIIMMAAHDPNQVLLHANRALIVEDGLVVADGAPATVMTPELLSHMYGINVQRYGLVDEADGQHIEICVPKGEHRRADEPFKRKPTRCLID